MRRLQGNASDKFLEIVTPTDLDALLSQLPQCRAIVTTGGKATETLLAHFNAQLPKIGSYAAVRFAGRPLRLYRMPSSSFAYSLIVSVSSTTPAFVFQRGFAVSPQFAWFRLVPMDMSIFLARFLVMTFPPFPAVPPRSLCIRQAWLASLSHEERTRSSKNARAVYFPPHSY